MKTGRRIANPATKQMMGTHRKDRHGDIAVVAVAASTSPVAPAYLTAEAKIVWAEELKRVTACGVTDADSSLFARYCEMESSFRVAVMAGELPKAALLTELRRSAELLGIAGIRSRLARGGAAPEAAKASPFTVRPR